ncbi:MAG: hypothetical protein IJJ04_03775 [Clostridia bacterium]|nr:hypothetical protein [Clostridia bacterium]
MKSVKKSITMRKSNNFFIMILALSLLLCAAAAYYYFNIYSKKYNPPPMETASVEGVPEIANEDWGYSPFGIDPEFRLKVCGEPEIDGNDVNIYLTSMNTNKVIMRCVLVSEDEPEKVLAESGTIKPGTYLKSIKLKEDLKSGSHGAILKVVAYDPETYFSKGTANLKIVLNKS